MTARSASALGARRLDDLLDRQVGVRYSAAVVRVERGGSVVYERAAGTLRGGGGGSVFVDTRFDLASITKVFVSTVALVLVARGTLALDAPLVDAVAEWRDTAHAAITLRAILAHTAGFRSGADYRTLFDEHIETFALREPLVAPAGERVVYSDLGFLALGAILARSTGIALEPLVERELRALGSERVTFARRARAEAIPATEYDAWRGLVQGRVHDEKAALAGGVAGHAGLFADARDVARLGEWYLGARRGRPSPLPPALAAAATTEAAPDPVLRRGLGWALKTSAANSCGALMSAQAFGHTGFTGTCIWVDPLRDLNVVTLTNAVHCGRHDLRDVRAAICDAAVEAFAA
ncbi:MAG TPA: serine hydrolase domain-containing protein [Candidatus Lustribacter sp.]